MGDLYFKNNLLYSPLLYLPPLRFHCVGGCWDQTQGAGILEQSMGASNPVGIRLSCRTSPSPNFEVLFVGHCGDRGGLLNHARLLHGTVLQVRIQIQVTGFHSAYSSFTKWGIYIFLHPYRRKKKYLNPDLLSNNL
jgi:hypothetical protein